MSNFLKFALLFLFMMLYYGGVASAAENGICNGKWALIAHYDCDGAPMSKQTLMEGNSGKCVSFGLDVNRNGRWDKGDKFELVFDNEKAKQYSYDEICGKGFCDHPEKSSCLP